MRGFRLTLLLALFAMSGVGAMTLAGHPSTDCDPGLAAPCVRVLFIGNSYTFENDLPGSFRALARTANRNVAVGMVAGGGETLSQHAASTDTNATITGGHWNVVVLQEQSEIPAFPASRAANMLPAAEALAATIRAAGAVPVLLETWAHQDGLPDAGMDESQMQQQINAGYMQVGMQLGAAVARAGEAWTRALEAGTPPEQLWQSDGSHPTVAGTRFAACSVYAAVFDGAPPAPDCAP
jgi:hypothetical protein